MNRKTFMRIIEIVRPHMQTEDTRFRPAIPVEKKLRCVKALHGHFRDDFNVSINHQSDEFGCFRVKIGSFIRNMTSSGLFTKKIRLLNRNFLLNTLSNMGYKTHLLAILGETIDSLVPFLYVKRCVLSSSNVIHLRPAKNSIIL